MGVSYHQKEYLYSYALHEPPELKMHMHRYYEILYFKKGDASYMVEDNIYNIYEGDIFITRPNELHTPVFHSNKMYERYFIQIEREFLDEFHLFDYLDSRGAGAENRICAADAERHGLYDFFTKIEKYVVNRVPESDAMIKSYLIQMMVSINNILKKPVRTDNSQTDRIDDIIAYLSNNISSDIGLDKLSDKFFLNKYYMCHAFKAKTGLTIKEFINTRKITRAKDLLLQGSDIMNLCYECGFNDYSTFYKTFKKLTGKSPRNFLKTD